MAWTAPYTWTAGEILTAAKLQTYVSDDLTYLKSHVDAADLLATGWVAVTGAWSYASATTITVPSGAMSIYNRGDKIRLKQGGGYKYYYIVIVADALLTVNGGTDFTVANSAITDKYYSMAAVPQDWPGGFAFAATNTGSTGSIGAYAEDLVTSRFTIIDKRCWVESFKRITNKGSWATDVRTALPIAPSCAGGYMTGPGMIIASGALTTKALPYLTSGQAYVVWHSGFSSGPIAWASLAVNDFVTLNLHYEY